MSIQDPIFQRQINGFASREWANRTTHAADMVHGSTTLLELGQMQLFQDGLPAVWLAKITAASAIGGASNRWTYDGVVLVIDGTSPDTTSDEYGKFTGALNIRELRNDSTKIDGTEIPAGASVGPVGSVYSGGAWTTSSLAGYVAMHASYKKDGSVLFWFDAPNPSRCG